MLQQFPHRSQSFRHRPRLSPNNLFKGKENNNNYLNNLTNYIDTTDNNNIELINNSTPERRRSTPTINRRASLRGGGLLINSNRLDTWPEPKQMSEAEERFLRLPDSADYTRVRQFNIDSKGAVISRGDSFRRKRINQNNNENINKKIINEDEQQQQQYLINERSSTRTSCSSSNISCSGGINSRIESSPEQKQIEGNKNNLIGNIYKICVIGESDVGKTSLIKQFISSSSYSDLDDYSQDNRLDNSVSVNIGGLECELKFVEINLNEIQNYFSSSLFNNFIGNFHLFLIVYSIDRKITFKFALKIIEQFRSIGCSLPIILVGNKADLERKRSVMENDVKNAMYTFDIAHFEISVALNHDIDDLLVGIVAQIKDSFQMNILTENENLKNKKIIPKTKELSPLKDSTTEDFQAAIRRFSRRKKRQMNVTSMNSDNGKCLNLFSKLRIWRKGSCSS